MYGSLLITTLPKFLGLRYFRSNSQDRLHQEVQQMIVIAPYLQARRGRHASLYLARNSGGPAPGSPRDRRAASLLDIRRRLDALRRCRVRQESVARINALLFACLLRHCAPELNQAIVFALVCSSRTSDCREAFAVVPRASRFAPARHRCAGRMVPRAAHRGLVAGSPGGGGIQARPPLLP